MLLLFRVGALRWRAAHLSSVTRILLPGFFLTALFGMLCDLRMVVLCLLFLLIRVLAQSVLSCR